MAPSSDPLPGRDRENREEWNFWLVHTLSLLSPIYRRWRIRSEPPALQGSRPPLETAESAWRWVETMTSPAILSDPFRVGSGNGASSSSSQK